MGRSSGDDTARLDERGLDFGGFGVAVGRFAHALSCGPVAGRLRSQRGARKSGGRSRCGQGARCGCGHEPGSRVLTWRRAVGLFGRYLIAAAAAPAAPFRSATRVSRRQARRSACACARASRARLVLACALGVADPLRGKAQAEILAPDAPLLVHEQSALHAVLEFTHIAWPLVTDEGLLGIVAQGRCLGALAASRSLQKVLGERQNIVGTIPQRRDGDLDDIQSEIEILSKGSLADGAGQVGVGGADHAHIDAAGHVAAQPLKLARLQHAQQFHLRPGRQIADLVQEKRRAVRLLEPADARAHGARERTGFRSEQLGVDEIVVKTARIDLHERLAAASTIGLHDLGDLLLAGSIRSGDEHRHVGGCHLHSQRHDLLHLRALVYDAAEIVATLKLPSRTPALRGEAQVLLLQLPHAQEILHDGDELVVVPGLGDIVIGPFFDELNRHLERREGRHEHDRQIGVEFANGSHELHPFDPRGRVATKIHILDDDAQVFARDEIESLFGRACRDDRNVEHVQQHLEGGAHRSLIVDYENFEHVPSPLTERTRLPPPSLPNGRDRRKPDLAAARPPASECTALYHRVRLFSAVAIVVTAATGALVGHSLAHPAAWAIGVASACVVGLVGLQLSVWRGLRTLDELRRGLERCSVGELPTEVREAEAGVFALLIRRFNELSVVLRERQRSAEQSEQLLHTVIDSAPMAILLLEDLGAIEYANEAARALFFESKPCEQANFLSLLGDAPAPFREAVLDVHDRLFTVDGETGPETYHLAKRQFELHGRTHTLLMVKHLTRELRRQEIDTWKKLIRVVSHELNNSLAPITSLVHSARLMTGAVRAGTAPAADSTERAPSTARTDKLDRVFSTIEERARHLQDFVESYARFARLPSPRREHVKVADFVRHIAELAPYARIAPAASQSATAYFDRAQVEQVLINLLKNAREAGGPEDGISLELQIAQDGGTSLVVADRGPGMSNEVLENAMLPFYSTKEHGSGLGLALCREIVEAHGGRIRVENRKDGGLMVVCILPGQKREESAAGAKLTLSRM